MTDGSPSDDGDGGTATNAAAAGAADAGVVTAQLLAANSSADGRSSAAKKSLEEREKGRSPLLKGPADDDDDGRMDVDVDDENDEGGDEGDEDQWVEATLYRLTSGLPAHELKTAVEEAHAVEELLLHEIHELEKALLQRQRQQQQQNQEQQPNSGTAEGTTTDAAASEEPAKKKSKEEADADGGGGGGDDDEEEEDDEDDHGDALRAIVESYPYTPLDGYWTISALLGRLRDGMALPVAPMPGAGAAAAAEGMPKQQPNNYSPPPDSKTTATTTAAATTTAGASSLTVDTSARVDPSAPNPPTTASSAGGGGGAVGGGGGWDGPDADPSSLAYSSLPRLLLELEKHPDYAAVHDNPASLLALHKKIAGHRCSAVFKKAVKVDDAPGYDARIFFPVDLSLIRKQIVARQVVSYRDLHERIAMIAHNCCKYNGRESDYGQVAREFERVGDDLIRQAVLNPQGLAIVGVPPTAGQASGRKSTPVAGGSGVAALGSDGGGGGGGTTKVDDTTSTAGTAVAAATEAKDPPTPFPAAAKEKSTATETESNPPAGVPLPSAPKLPPVAVASSSTTTDDRTTSNASLGTDNATTT
jgi:Bromodomain